MFSSPPPVAEAPKSKKHLSTFSVYHKETLVIVLVTLILALALVWFGLVVKQKVTKVEQQWLDYSNESTLSSHVLSRIQTNFGYGGFIHNFKNYVLRKDASLIPKIEKGLAETRRAINDYPLRGIFQDVDDETYLNNLAQVVDQYAVNFELAKRLVAKGVSSNDIDRQVKVNDAPATQAIKHLSQHVVNNNIKSSLETSKRLGSALTFINWGLLLVPLVLLSGLFMLVLLRKITEVNHSLEESRKFLSDLFEAAPDAMLIVDDAGIICEANQQVEKLFGYSKKSLIGTRVESLMPKRFRNQHIKLRNNSFIDSKVRALMNELELYVLGNDNKEIPVDISLSYTTRNEQKYTIVTLRDITKQKKDAETLKLADNVFNSTAESIIVTDLDEHILRVNSAFTMMTGYSSEEAIGKTPGQLLKSGKHDKEFYKSMWTALEEKGNWQGEICDRRKDGSLFPARHNISAVKDSRGKVIQYISIFLDITEKKNAEKRIQYLAQYDQLTKLPNRTLFNDRLKHSIDRAQRNKNKIGLMFIDLDGFKDINDSMGHQAGDELLKIIAERLSNIMRKEDTVARLGGDEFTIILEELVHSDYAVVVAKKALQAVGEVIYLSGHEVTVGASIGISIYENNGEDADSLIKNADTAMYQAKKQGKNCYKFYL